MLHAHVYLITYTLITWSDSHVISNCGVPAHPYRHLLLIMTSTPHNLDCLARIARYVSISFLFLVPSQCLLMAPMYIGSKQATNLQLWDRNYPVSITRLGTLAWAVTLTWSFPLTKLAPLTSLVWIPRFCTETCGHQSRPYGPKLMTVRFGRDKTTQHLGLTPTISKMITFNSGEICSHYFPSSRNGYYPEPHTRVATYLVCISGVDQDLESRLYFIVDRFTPESGSLRSYVSRNEANDQCLQLANNRIHCYPADQWSQSRDNLTITFLNNYDFFFFFPSVNPDVELIWRLTVIGMRKDIS